MARARQADGVRPAVRTIPFRIAVVLRGAGYGLVTGMISGALLGALVELPYPPWLIFSIPVGGVIGGATGLVAGVLGGVVFALAARCLARDPAAARLAGAAVLPGTLLVAWCALAVVRRSTADVLAARHLTAYLVLSAVGGIPGALVGPRVLWGKRGLGGDRTGDEEADSLR
jgi:hypothetical protein